MTQEILFLLFDFVNFLGELSLRLTNLLLETTYFLSESFKLLEGAALVLVYVHRLVWLIVYVLAELFEKLDFLVGWQTCLDSF